jgi:hypothetical protein
MNVNILGKPLAQELCRESQVGFGCDLTRQFRVGWKAEFVLVAGIEDDFASELVVTIMFKNITIFRSPLRPF